MAGLRKPRTYKVNRAANKNALKKKTVFFNFGEGVHRLRVVPPMNEDGMIFVKATNHYNFESSEGYGIAPACMVEHGDGDCWICRLVNYLNSTGDPGDEKIAAKIKPSSKWHVQAFVWDGEKYDGPFLCGFSKGAADQVNDRLDELDALDSAYFCDPDEGFDLIVTRKGTSFKDTRYSVSCGNKVSKLDDLVPDWHNKVFVDVMEKVDPRIMTAAEMREAMIRTYGDALDWEVIDKEVPIA